MSFRCVNIIWCPSLARLALAIFQIAASLVSANWPVLQKCSQEGIFYRRRKQLHVLTLVYRLQVQERVTKQIATSLMEILQPQGVAVVMEASHLCMCMR